MGFERNGAALFLKMRGHGVRFGSVLTLGRQNIHMYLDDYRRVLRRLGLAPAAAVPEYVDDLLLAMGATQVQAMDFSAYEGAGLVHDLNQPIPPQWREQFDVVFDGGTLEHVFNFPVAIKNCMEMLKPKGRFVAVTMPNNWCGHGFYQFSPELFFRILSPANGFSIIDMYLTTLGGNAYTVIDPEAVRSRVELCNKIPVFLLVHARRDEVKEIFSQTPQQSDYVTQWNGGTSQQSLRLQVAWKNYPLIRHLRQFHMNLLMRRSLRSRSLGNRKFYRPADLSI